MKKVFQRASFIKEIFFWLFSLVVAFYFFTSAIQNLIVLNEWDDSTLKTFQGSYQVSIKKYNRNTNYRFILDNGDTLEVPPELLSDDNSISEYKELQFVYHKYIHPFRSDYDAFSIKTTDGSITFLDKAITYTELKGSIGVFLFLGICSITPAILISVLICIEKNCFIKRRKKKK